MNTLSSPWTAPVSSSRLCTAWPSLTQPGTIPSSTSWHNVWSLLSLTQCLLQRLAQPGPMPSPTSGPNSVILAQRLLQRLTFTHLSWHNAFSNVRLHSVILVQRLQERLAFTESAWHNPPSPQVSQWPPRATATARRRTKGCPPPPLSLASGFSAVTWRACLCPSSTCGPCPPCSPWRRPAPLP